jgi:hypothetical protein
MLIPNDQGTDPAPIDPPNQPRPGGEIIATPTDAPAAPATPTPAPAPAPTIGSPNFWQLAGQQAIEVLETIGEQAAIALVQGLVSAAVNKLAKV